jgi:hypothetical protein
MPPRLCGWVGPASRMGTHAYAPLPNRSPTAPNRSPTAYNQAAGPRRHRLRGRLHHARRHVRQHAAAREHARPAARGRHQPARLVLQVRWDDGAFAYKASQRVTIVLPTRRLSVSAARWCDVVVTGPACPVLLSADDSVFIVVFIVFPAAAPLARPSPLVWKSTRVSVS